jgi:hypothetical protein
MYDLYPSSTSFLEKRKTENIMPFSVPKIKREIRRTKIWANRVAKRTPEEYNIRRFSHP